MHSAQGATADTTHAVLGETTSRDLLYVALTRGRDTDHVYLHDRQAGEGDHEHREAPGVHTLRRGTNLEAAQLVCGILAGRDDQAQTSHLIADKADRDQLLDRVQDFVDPRAKAVQNRRSAYRARQHPHPRHDRQRSQDYGLEL